MTRLWVWRLMEILSPSLCPPPQLMHAHTHTLPLSQTKRKKRKGKKRKEKKKKTEKFTQGQLKIVIFRIQVLEVCPVYLPVATLNCPPLNAVSPHGFRIVQLPVLRRIQISLDCMSDSSLGCFFSSHLCFCFGARCGAMVNLESLSFAFQVVLVSQFSSLCGRPHALHVHLCFSFISISEKQGDVKHPFDAYTWGSS